jgi:hypothetical protein
LGGCFTNWCGVFGGDLSRCPRCSRSVECIRDFPFAGGWCIIRTCFLVYRCFPHAVFRLATCTDRGIITVAMAFLGRRMCRRHYTDWNVGSAVVALLGQGISFAFHHQVYHDMALLQSLHSSSTHHSIHHDLATCNLPVSPKRSASIRPLAFRSRINNNNNLHVHPHLSKESRIPHDDAPSLLSVLPLSLLWISNTQLDDQLAHSSPVASRCDSSLALTALSAR